MRGKKKVYVKKSREKKNERKKRRTKRRKVRKGRKKKKGKKGKKQKKARRKEGENKNTTPRVSLEMRYKKEIRFKSDPVWHRINHQQQKWVGSLAKSFMAPTGNRCTTPPSHKNVRYISREKISTAIM